MKPTKIIDTHQHVFWHGRNDDGLIADMDAHGIESAWLLTWEIAREEDNPLYHRILNPLHRRDDGTHRGIVLEDILRARDRFPSRFTVGYCPHPLLGNAPELLRAAARMHGVRVCGEWKFRVLFDDPRCLELFQVAGELRLPVVLHLDVPYLQIEGKRTYQDAWYGGTVENLERALQACPDTLFIGHAPGFWREISGDAATDPEWYPESQVSPGGRLFRLLEEYPNLYADLSAGSALVALRRNPQLSTQFIQQYAGKLFFARDYYGTELHDFLQTLPLPTETIQKIYWRNAQSLLQA